MENEKDHARDNAAGWADNIVELVSALECDYDRLAELNDERDELVLACANARQEDQEKIDDSAAYAVLALCERALEEWEADNGEELDELVKAATLDGELCKDGENARERIQESPLSVEVRSGWYNPGSENEPPEEFRILLSTGGPALQIRGELDEHRQPYRAWLEYQDWGTPWTQYFGDNIEHSTLLTFCQQFFFGE